MQTPWITLNGEDFADSQFIIGILWINKYRTLHMTIFEKKLLGLLELLPLLFSLFENATVKRSSQFVASSFHTIIALLLGLIMLRFSKLIFYTIIPNSCRDAVQKVWRLHGQPSHKRTAGHRALLPVSFLH
jgi:hypothetical protein